MMIGVGVRSSSQPLAPWRRPQPQPPFSTRLKSPQRLAPSTIESGGECPMLIGRDVIACWLVPRACSGDFGRTLGRIISPQHTGRGCDMAAECSFVQVLSISSDAHSSRSTGGKVVASTIPETIVSGGQAEGHARGVHVRHLCGSEALLCTSIPSVPAGELRLPHILSPTHL